MKRLLIEDLNLEEFLQIVTNTSEEVMQCFREEEKKHWEPSQSRSDRNHDIENSNNIWKQEIFSIKDQTKNKTELMIVDMIKQELGIEENEAILWNRMIKAIEEVNLASDSRYNDDKLLSLMIDFIC